MFLARASTRSSERPRALPTSRTALARAIGDDDGRHAGPVAAVLVVDVLQHLLAPLVLEIDVDVRRLVPLLADEPLEQHVDPLGIDAGHAQAVADRRVGRRAAALAQDVPLAGEPHQVPDREKIGLVPQLLDQRQLVLDQAAAPCRGTPCGYRSCAPSQVKLREILAAACKPAGASSSGYSYFSSSSENVHRSAISSVRSIASGTRGKHARRSRRSAASAAGRWRTDAPPADRPSCPAASPSASPTAAAGPASGNAHPPPPPAAGPFASQELDQPLQLGRIIRPAKQLGEQIAAAGKDVCCRERPPWRSGARGVGDEIRGGLACRRRTEY